MQQPISCEETVADLEACLASTNAQNTDPTSQCNADDGKFAFDTCRCSKLSDVCSQVPVDCVNGYERGTGVTCDRACAGLCCNIESRSGSWDTVSACENDSPCGGFTGLVYRDGSCTGNGACKDSTIDEVKGPSCTGDRACYQAEVDLIEGGCNGDFSCFLSRDLTK